MAKENASADTANATRKRALKHLRTTDRPVRIALPVRDCATRWRRVRSVKPLALESSATTTTLHCARATARSSMLPTLTNSFVSVFLIFWVGIRVGFDALIAFKCVILHYLICSGHAGWSDLPVSWWNWFLHILLLILRSSANVSHYGGSQENER